MDALLERARKATNRRNELLHGLWAQELDGDPIMRAEGLDFGPIPSVQSLEGVADDLLQIAHEITTARLDGFLKDALDKP